MEKVVLVFSEGTNYFHNRLEEKLTADGLLAFYDPDYDLVNGAIGDYQIIVVDSVALEKWASEGSENPIR